MAEMKGIEVGKRKDKGQTAENKKGTKERGVVRGVHILDNQ